MSRRPNISLPLLASSLEVRPLALHREKELPPTPKSDEVKELEFENEALLRELDFLRGVVKRLEHKMIRYRQIAKGCKAFVRDVGLRVQQVETAALTLQEVERAAEQEWSSHRKVLETHVIQNGARKGFI